MFYLFYFRNVCCYLVKQLYISALFVHEKSPLEKGEWSGANYLLLAETMQL